MKILVPGGAGLIGYHISKFHLAAGDEVIVMDNLERSALLDKQVSAARLNFNRMDLEKRGATFLRADVSKLDEWPRNFHPDRIYHMAAQTSVPASLTHPLRDFEINTLGVQHMLDYARARDSKVVYASTNKVYPIHSGFEKIDGRWDWHRESDRKYGFPKDNGGLMMEGARTPYGNTKYMGDLLCQEYFHSFGVQTGIFRMSCIFGTSQFAFEEQGWLTWFIIANLKREPIRVFGDGDQVRDILWVEDVVKAYNSFMDSGINHGIWQLGGGPNQTCSINEAIAIIEELTGIPFEVSYHDWRPADQRIYTSNIRPVQDDLNWTPTVTIREGLEEVIDWAKDVLEVF